MNKNEVIGLLANYVQQAVDFSVAKAPEVLQQYISLQLLISAIVFVIACAALAFFTVYIKKSAKKGDSDAVILLFSPLIISLLIAALTGFKCLSILLYPEGWLLSQFLTK